MNKRKAQILRLKAPVAMALAKRPANRAGFKVIRSDSEDQVENESMATKTANQNSTEHTRTTGTKKRKKTWKREDTLYSIRLPDGISQEEADQLLSAFAMTEDYEVYKDTDGAYWFKRKNLDNFEKIMKDIPAMAIDMGNDFVAYIDSGVFDSTATRADGFHGVKLVELQLDGYTISEAKNWIDDHGVDFVVGGVEEVDGGVVVTRHEYVDADARKVRLGDGITGIVVRSAENDIPEHLYRAVMEESYGYYGWGVLDFAQYLATPYYTNGSWDGINALKEVLTTITLYSGLPLEERMQLVDNALLQYSSYYKALIEAMPREAITASQRFDNQSEDVLAQRAATKTVNSKGVSTARAAINAGRVNSAAAWSFSAADGNKLLGPNGDNWERYSSVHLARVSGADAKTKEAYAYPVAKLTGQGITVFRSGVRAARTRSAQQNSDAISKAARGLLDLMDKKSGKSAMAQDSDLSVRTDDEDSDMPKANDKTRNAASVDETGQATDSAGARTDTQDDTGAIDDGSKYVTRSELKTAVADAVKEVLAQRDDAAVAGDGEGSDATQTRSDDGTPSRVDEQLAKAVTQVAETMTKLVERMDSFDTKLDQYGESTEVRSDGVGVDGASESDNKADVFDGMLGALSGLRKV